MKRLTHLHSTPKRGTIITKFEKFVFFYKKDNLKGVGHYCNF